MKVTLDTTDTPGQKMHGPEDASQGSSTPSDAKSDEGGDIISNKDNVTAQKRGVLVVCILIYYKYSFWQLFWVGLWAPCLNG